MQQFSGNFRDLLNGCVESGFVGIRWFVKSAQLSDELQGSCANLVVRHGRFKVKECFDVSTHNRYSVSADSAQHIAEWGIHNDCLAIAQSFYEVSRVQISIGRPFRNVEPRLSVLPRQSLPLRLL